MDTRVPAEEVEAEPLAGGGQRLGIDVDAKQPHELVVPAQPVQQLSPATAEISYMSGARSKHSFDDSVQAGAMQGRRH